MRVRYAIGGILVAAQLAIPSGAAGGHTVDDALDPDDSADDTEDDE